METARSSKQSFPLSRRTLIDLVAFVLVGLPTAGVLVYAVGGAVGLIAALAMPVWMIELSIAERGDRLSGQAVVESTDQVREHDKRHENGQDNKRGEEH